MNHYKMFGHACKSETKEAFKNLAMQFRRNKHSVSSNAVKHSVNRSFSTASSSSSSNSYNKCCCGNCSRNTIFDDFKLQFFSLEPTSTPAEKFLCFGGGVVTGLAFIGTVKLMLSQLFVHWFHRDTCGNRMQCLFEMFLLPESINQLVLVHFMIFNSL